MEDRFIVIDLGGTHVRVALADRSLKPRGILDEPTDFSRGPDSVVGQIHRLTDEARAGERLRSVDVRLLVVGCPGPLDTNTGVVFSPPNLIGWGDVPLRALLEDALGIRVKVVNDANAAALGEFHFGAGRGHRNMVYITVSTGIGGGIVVDGRLVEGSSGTAGEIGHVTIDRSGPPCKCGNVGCLEAIASGTAIARRFQEQRDAGRETLADSWLNGREATAADVAKAAREGDRLASEIFNDAAEAVGIGVVNCIHLLNPDVIAIGGGVTKAGNLLFDGLRRVVDRTAFPVPRKIVSIVPAQLGEEVGLIGAAAIAADDLRRELDTVLVSQ